MSLIRPTQYFNCPSLSIFEKESLSVYMEKKYHTTESAGAILIHPLRCNKKLTHLLHSQIFFNPSQCLNKFFWRTLSMG